MRLSFPFDPGYVLWMRAIDTRFKATENLPKKLYERKKINLRSIDEHS